MYDNSYISDTLHSLLGVSDIRILSKEVSSKQLFEYVFDTDNRVARNAAWALTHKPVGELLPLPQERLVDLTLTTPDTSLRRLTLALIERQGIKEEDMRTDLLDFCLRHMMLLDEPAGVQADGSIEFGAFGAVLDVPLNRVSNVRELRPNLMMATGMQLHFQ